MPNAAVVAPERPAPGPLAPTETSRFPSRDGIHLHGEWFSADEPRAAALVVHGYAEHCGRYRELAHVLVQMGVAVLTYDMRGHGRAEGQRGHVEDYAEYLDDMDAAFAELDQRVAGHDSERPLPRLLVAHSNGALIALRALVDPDRAPDRVIAAVLSSPFLRLHDELPLPKRLLGRAAGRWLPRLSLANPLPVEHLTADPDRQAERRVDTLCHDVASAGWFTAALAAQDYVADHASGIGIPTQWLVAHGDRIVDPAASRVVRARLRAPSEYHGMEGMEHEIFNELERGRVFATMQRFVEGFLLAR